MLRQRSNLLWSILNVQTFEGKMKMAKLVRVGRHKSRYLLIHKHLLFADMSAECLGSTPSNNSWPSIRNTVASSIPGLPLETRLFLLRRAVALRAREVFVCSLSCRTITYKGGHGSNRQRRTKQQRQKGNKDKVEKQEGQQEQMQNTCCRIKTNENRQKNSVCVIGMSLLRGFLFALCFLLSGCLDLTMLLVPMIPVFCKPNWSALWTWLGLQFTVVNLSRERFDLWAELIVDSAMKTNRKSLVGWLFYTRGCPTSFYRDSNKPWFQGPQMPGWLMVQIDVFFVAGQFKPDQLFEYYMDLRLGTPVLGWSHHGR